MLLQNGERQIIRVFVPPEPCLGDRWTVRSAPCRAEACRVGGSPGPWTSATLMQTVCGGELPLRVPGPAPALQLGGPSIQLSEWNFECVVRLRSPKTAISRVGRTVSSRGVSRLFGVQPGRARGAWGYRRRRAWDVPPCQPTLLICVRHRLPGTVGASG